MYNIALSTSLSWDKDWDPYCSINLTKEHDISNIQIFLGNNFLDNNSLCNEVADYCNKSLTVIVHSPVDLNEKALDSALIRDLGIVLKYNQKLVVYHHNFNYPVDKTIEVIRELNERGIIVLLENFYESRSNEDVTRNIISYKDVISKAVEEGLALYPLLDIPRLFIDGIENSLELTFNLIEYIGIKKLPLYLHLIDCTNSSQGRDSWCPLGSGIIPYDQIFNMINTLKIDIPLAVLEFEDIEHVEESIKYLEGI